jgi:futalosine hydrolase
MYLVVTATSAEQQQLRDSCPKDVQFLVAGVGLVETTFRLTTYLHQHSEIQCVVNLGIGGGFASEQVAILDCCLASSETVGDLGICFDTKIEPLDRSLLSMDNVYPCGNPSSTLFSSWLKSHNHPFHEGPFLSVNCVSGTFKRGALLNRNHCLCENMEGAGVARVCHGFNLDWFEFRVISNLVEDRDHSSWQIRPAIQNYSDIMTSFFKEEIV